MHRRNAELHSVQKVRIRVGLDTGFMVYTVLYIHETPFNSTKVTYLNILKVTHWSSGCGCLLLNSMGPRFES